MTKRFALRPKDLEDIRLLEILKEGQGRRHFYRNAPITSWAPTMANSRRMAPSSRLVYHAL